MNARADVLKAAVILLHDMPPYDQCRHIAMMVHDGTLTHEQGKELLYALVEYEISPIVH
jgi:hypothetical protein